METTQKVLFVSAIAASLIAPTVVQADNCSGHYIETTTTSESAEIAKGTTLLSFRETNIGVTDDPNNPINMSAGECSGAGIVTSDGKFQGRGLCVRKDKDGDVFMWSWDTPLGAKRGTWAFIGGTGKYADAKWSGWYEPTLSQGKMSGGRWGGTCQ